jgi:SAM-dependent methyltransferase
MAPRKRHARPSSRSWDPVAAWYAGWVGANGSDHHRRFAIPALLDLLQPRQGERILDLGCGPGALAADIGHAGSHYTGIDASSRLLSFARRHHDDDGKFLIGDVTRLRALRLVPAASFDAVTFLLSIQDIEPLESALDSAAYALRGGGRVVLLMTHPCFRIPRQSGWGWDAGRRLRFRRVDRYLTRLDVPMKSYAAGRGATRSYHRPLGTYINGLAAHGLLVDRIVEVPVLPVATATETTRAERLSLREIPLFLGLRAIRR